MFQQTEVKTNTDMLFCVVLIWFCCRVWVTVINDVIKTSHIPVSTAFKTTAPLTAQDDTGSASISVCGRWGSRYIRHCDHVVDPKTFLQYVGTGSPTRDTYKVKHPVSASKTHSVSSKSSERESDIVLLCWLLYVLQQSGESSEHH